VCDSDATGVISGADDSSATRGRLGVANLPTSMATIDVCEAIATNGALSSDTSSPAVLVLGAGAGGSSVSEVLASPAGLAAAVVSAGMRGAGDGDSVGRADGPSTAGREPATDTSPYAAKSVEHRAPLRAGGVHVGADVVATSIVVGAGVPVTANVVFGVNGAGAVGNIVAGISTALGVGLGATVVGAVGVVGAEFVQGGPDGVVPGAKAPVELVVSNGVEDRVDVVLTAELEPGRPGGVGSVAVIPTTEVSCDGFACPDDGVIRAHGVAIGILTPRASRGPTARPSCATR
jgi:hypothetical protein